MTIPRKTSQLDRTLAEAVKQPGVGMVRRVHGRYIELRAPVSAFSLGRGKYTSAIFRGLPVDGVPVGVR